jgi:hypothetical protein
MEMFSIFEMQEVFIDLLGAYPNFNPKIDLGDMIRAYHRALRDMPPAAVRRSILMIIRDNKFFPTASEIYVAAKRTIAEFAFVHEPLCTLPDGIQRWQDEIYGFAQPLLSKDGNFSPGEIDEWERLEGKRPLDVAAAVQ